MKDNTIFVSRVLMTLALTAMLILSGCHGYPPPDPNKQPDKPWAVNQNAKSPDQVKWTYLPGGLVLNLTTTPDLNTYEGYTHNVLLCIYQLNAPAAFQELASNAGGILKLLKCTRFDPTVVHVERHFVSPGQKSTLILDRAEGAQYMALVAGFNDLQPGLVTTLYSFPVTTGRDGWTPWAADVYNPGGLTMNILLGANSIQRMGVE